MAGVDSVWIVLLYYNLKSQFLTPNWIEVLLFPGARDVGGHWDHPAAAAIQKSDFMLYIHRAV